MKKTLLILSAIFLFFAGCKKDDVIEASKVEVKNEVIEEGSNYIKINAEYVYPEEMAAVSLYLSEQENMSDAKVYECKMEGKTFSVEANGLKENKKYHYCYEFDNGYEKKTVYGEQRSFTTLDPPTINGHEYVDLGLPSGLKWATCNVGADSPEDYGDYFAWGETETKTEYTQDNSLTYGLSISQLQSQGYIDGSGNLTPSHDAATANWGSSWRMPTKEESEELKNECTWTWTTQNGVNGCKVTGPNGNHIFLPAAGFRGGSSLNSDGRLGGYWSSTLYDNDHSAYALYFGYGGEYVNYQSRRNGFTVRPITE